MTHLASYVDNSMVVGGPEWDRLIAAITNAGIWARLAFAERAGDRIYMAQSLISPSGEVVIYRHKLRPFGFRAGYVQRWDH